MDEQNGEVLSKEMDGQARELLIKEFETSWQQLFNIDHRRGVFFNYFNVAFFAVLVVTAGIWTSGKPLSLVATIAFTATYLLLVLMARTIIRILESEREANVRYRKKINLIRRLFLSEVEDDRIQTYLLQKDIGIRASVSTGHPPIDKVGETLKHIYFLLRTEQTVLLVLILLTWSIWFTSQGSV